MLLCYMPVDPNVIFVTLLYASGPKHYLCYFVICQWTQILSSLLCFRAVYSNIIEITCFGVSLLYKSDSFILMLHDNSYVTIMVQLLAYNNV